MNNVVRPTVSVIVPIYNIEKYVDKCIKSILAQTYQNIEILLVDDGSTDNSQNIVDAYSNKDCRIIAIHKQNGGLTSARNAGLEAASGEWIMHVDGDDWIEPNMIAEMLDTANKQGADMIIGDLRFVYDDRSSIYELNDWSDDKVTSLNCYITKTWTSICGGMAKKSLYDSHNLHSPIGISYCEDFHLAVRLCYFSDKIIHINKPYYNYRQQQMSIVHNLNKKSEEEEQWVYQDTIKFFKEHGVYDEYRKTINWRVLKSTQELLLSPSSHSLFIELFADGQDYIWSCPFVNNKIKLMAWLIIHRMRFLVVVFDKLRVLFRR